MLQVSNSSIMSSERSSDSRFVPQLDALGLLRIVYRQWPTILTGVAICFVLAIVYLFLAQPKYSSSFLIYIDPRQAQIVELRFFAGLTIEEIATTLGLSPATVKRDWSTAKLWLRARLAE